MEEKGVAAFSVLCSAVLLAVFISSPQPLQAQQEPSIRGTITVLDKGGKPKDDHSGIVVFLDEFEKPVPIPPPAERGVIHQSGKRFRPAVLPILAGTTVDFPNDDVIFHNVFSLSKAKPFDLGLYKQGESRSVTFDRPGLVKVYCNIHPDMVANILVLPNSFFAVTDPEGRFVIPNVPLGAVTVRTWYSKGTNHPEERIQVTPAGILDLEMRVTEGVRFQIREESISFKHRNKWGEEYASKY